MVSSLSLVGSHSPASVEYTAFLLDYVSSLNPDQMLRYIATISNRKSPGETELEDGIGNAVGLKESDDSCA